MEPLRPRPLDLLRELPELLRELDAPEPLREDVLREERDEPELRELEPLVRLRDEADELRRRAVERCDDGISAVATAFVSVGICFSRKDAMRSSSRRIRFAS